jgi:hypothetical protein
MESEHNSQPSRTDSELPSDSGAMAPLRLAFGWRAFLSVATAAAHDLEARRGQADVKRPTRRCVIPGGWSATRTISGRSVDGFREVRHHPRFPCDDVRDGPTHRKLGGRYSAEKAGYRVHPWCSADSEPREARKLRLRVLQSYPTGQIWRGTLASRKDFQAAQPPGGEINAARKPVINKIRLPTANAAQSALR